MLGHSIFNLLQLQHVPLPWLPRFKESEFGMEILDMLCGPSEGGSDTKVFAIQVSYLCV